MRKTLVLLVAAASLWPVAGHAAEEWTRTYTVHGQPAVSLGADDGSIEVRPGPAGQVSIHVTTRGFRAGELRVVERQDGNRIHYEVREPHLRWGFSYGQRGVRIEVTVPHTLDLVVGTGDGAISVSDLEGHLVLKTGDGNLQAEALKGDIELGTGDGDIRARGLEGHLGVHSGDGTVEVAGRFDALRAGSGDGSMAVEALEGSAVETPWVLSTGDGPITLRLADDFRADLDAHTGDGSIDLQVPVEILGHFGTDHRNVRGRIHGGGGLLQLSTGDGPIRIEAR